ncbi:hypothetical protein SAMN04488055_3649 [Chitinophaga niabensis]|uniref:Uncharacterized protein n=1 Tax=Chitinophaga niabensis TaxID=536979 RepID=A0A1N6J5K3_9BACT|nr:hypothetical protein SAMN04488055_3649 [Chitinophaga niabensis]
MTGGTYGTWIWLRANIGRDYMYRQKVRATGMNRPASPF